MHDNDFDEDDDDESEDSGFKATGNQAPGQRRSERVRSKAQSKAVVKPKPRIVKKAARKLKVKKKARGGFIAVSGYRSALAA